LGIGGGHYGALGAAIIEAHGGKRSNRGSTGSVLLGVADCLRGILNSAVPQLLQTRTSNCWQNHTSPGRNSLLLSSPKFNLAIEDVLIATVAVARHSH